MRKRILIVSPALARANNGNWQTASRWARFLRGAYEVEVTDAWQSKDPAPDLLIALHARRSASSVAAFTNAHPDKPTLLVLTGTDVYRDIHDAPEAQASLRRAAALVVLQDDAVNQLPAGLHPKTHVIYQSAPALRPWQPPATRRYFDVCMIGHLRDEKDPLTFIRAAAHLTHPAARLLHIGGALVAELGEAATAAMQAHPRYRWLGPLPHADARQRLKRCHAMAIASKMEGGANVIIEAVTCGVPVFASDIGGNRGMLGADYAGYFPLGDDQALARLIERSILDAPFYELLRRQCAERARLFAPEAEQAALRDLVDNLLRANLQAITKGLEPT